MFVQVDAVSEPGSPERPNEDAFGSAGAFAWVIDTSIFPGTPPVMPAASDAAWLAGFASRRFAALAPNAADGATLVGEVMREARDAFFAAAPAERREDPVTWPIGAITLVRAERDRLDVWTLADTTAFVRAPGSRTATLGEAPERRAWEAGMAAELMAKTGSTAATIGKTPAFRTWLTERREAQKAGDGPPLFGLTPQAASHMLRQSADCPAGSAILLTSDGFSALVDLYRRYDADTLLDRALADGLAPLVAKARRIERDEDPDGRAFPRFKASDDATALLLRRA